MLMSDFEILVIVLAIIELIVLITKNNRTWFQQVRFTLLNYISGPQPYIRSSSFIWYSINWFCQMATWNRFCLPDVWKRRVDKNAVIWVKKFTKSTFLFKNCAFCLQTIWALPLPYGCPKYMHDGLKQLFWVNHRKLLFISDIETTIITVWAIIVVFLWHWHWKNN